MKKRSGGGRERNHCIKTRRIAPLKHAYGRLAGITVPLLKNILAILA